jgi:hypothetical protein
MIVGLVRMLPADKQEQILAHARQLRDQSSDRKSPRKSGRGLWADLGIDRRGHRRAAPRNVEELSLLVSAVTRTAQRPC